MIKFISRSLMKHRFDSPSYSKHPERSITFPMNWDLVNWFVYWYLFTYIKISLRYLYKKVAKCTNVETKFCMTRHQIHRHASELDFKIFPLSIDLKPAIWFWFLFEMHQFCCIKEFCLLLLVSLMDFSVFKSFRMKWYNFCLNFSQWEV